MSTTTAEVIQSLFALNAPALIPAAVALIASACTTFIAKEKDFETKVTNLLKQLMDKKVAALALLFESVDFVSTSLGEVREFKGKRFFADIDKYSSLESQVMWYSRVHRAMASFFHWAIAVSIVITLVSFINRFYFPVISIVLSVFLVCLVVVGICIMRRSENKISKLCEMDDLRHEE